MKRVIIFTDRDDYGTFNGWSAVRVLEDEIELNYTKDTNKKYMITIEEIEDLSNY